MERKINFLVDIESIVTTPATGVERFLRKLKASFKNGIEEQVTTS